MRTGLRRGMTGTGRFLLEGLVVTGCAAVGDDTGARFVRDLHRRHRRLDRDVADGMARLEEYLRANSSGRHT